MTTALACPMLPDTRRVVRVRRETHDTVTLGIDAPNGSFPILPGQFNMLYVFAVGEVPISTSGDASKQGEIVHTVKGVGAVSTALTRLRRGSTVGVRGPYGSAWPLEEARGKDLVLVAGGLGIAPLRPVVYHVIANRSDFGEVSVLAGARTPEDLVYRRELDAWGRRGRIRVLTTADRASTDWRGRVGVVTALLAETPLNTDRTVVFVCGPEIMMRFTLRELAQRGVRDEHIHLSLERNMKCAVGFCGHCQFGPDFVCRDGPVFRFDRIRSRFWLREV